MTPLHFEILVEEPSAEAFLRALLPRMLPIEVTFQVYSFQCKDDLLLRLPDRLRGYAAWLPEDYRIVVLVDRDDEDCLELKRRLDSCCLDAGLSCRAHGLGDATQVLNRIVIEELEAWYFGDWPAVRQAFPRVSKTVPEQAKYRQPDAIAGGTWEALERILQRAGYFKTGLRKIELARTVGCYADAEHNRSHSFQTFRKGLQDLVDRQR